MYKVIVAGSRSFNDYSLLEKELIGFLLGYRRSQVEIVSGTARGADRLGETFAKRQKCKLKQFPADWNKYGKSAGYIRNSEMGDYADACIVFWDGESKGTKHMIDLAKTKGLRVKVVLF